MATNLPLYLTYISVLNLQTWPLTTRYKHNVVLLNVGGDHRLDITDEKCQTCARDFIAFYCENHNYIGCGTCTMQSHRRCEYVIDLTDDTNIQIQPDKLDAVTSDMYKFDNDIDEAEINVDRSTTLCKEDKAKCLSDVNDFRVSLDNELDQIHSHMETDIHATYIDIEQRNQTAANTCKTARRINQQCKDELETTCKRYQPRRFYLAFRRATNVIEKFRPNIEKAKRDGPYETYAFIPDQTLKDTILSNVKNFGSIDIKGGSEEVGYLSRYMYTILIFSVTLFSANP